MPLANDEKIAAYDREHDPTPITPELLIADGHEYRGGGFYYHSEHRVMVMSHAGGSYRYEGQYASGFAKTLGQLRTALRLARGE
jgi:hypothetical protein